MARFDLSDIQQKIHRIVELNVDYPVAGDDEYDLRTGLINDHVEDWENEEGILWNELWKLASFTSTSASSYVLSSVSPTITDMKSPGGFVELNSSGSTYWEVKKPEEVRLLTNNSDPWCYFLGNPQSGFTLYFKPNCYPGGGTIKFPYYKTATRLVADGSKPEMSNPQYLVHMAASDILAQDDPGESDKHLQIAQNLMRAMKTSNLMSAPYMKNRVEDRAGLLWGSGFGK
jgi:hypothetical protein